MKTKKELILGIAIVIIVGLLSTMLIYKNDTQPQTQSSETVLASLQETISISARITEAKSVDWADGYNQVVPLKGSRFEIGSLFKNYIGKYGSFSNINEITEESLKPFKSAIESFFIKNGFSINTLNNKRTPLSISYGYTLNDIKCLVSLSPHSSPFGRVFCGTVDNQELAWRKELVPIINPKNDPDRRVSVNKLIGNYATGGVGGYGGGAIWYAVKVNGQWKKVWTGQNTISCEPVKQYNIPKEIWRGPGAADDSECSNDY